MTLDAYRASSAAFEQALATANPEDPALAATMIDPQLQSVKGNLLADQRQGIVGRGTVTLHPKVVSIAGAPATTRSSRFGEDPLHVWALAIMPGDCDTHG